MVEAMERLIAEGIFWEDLFWLSKLSIEKLSSYTNAKFGCNLYPLLVIGWGQRFCDFVEPLIDFPLCSILFLRFWVGDPPIKIICSWWMNNYGNRMIDSSFHFDGKTMFDHYVVDPNYEKWLFYGGHICDVLSDISESITSKWNRIVSINKLNS